MDCTPSWVGSLRFTHSEPTRYTRYTERRGNQDKLPVGDLEFAIARNLGSIGVVFWERKEKRRKRSGLVLDPFPARSFFGEAET